MKDILKIAALAALVATPSFAIVGVGFHYAPNLGSISATSGVMSDSAGVASLNFDQKSVKGLQGFGGKIWIDALPFVDIEGTFNMQFARYNAALRVVDSLNNNAEYSYPLSVKFDGFPFGEASPLFGLMTGDLSVTYPFLKFPPAVTIARLYVGAGVSYFASTPVVDSKFALKALGTITPEEAAALATDEAAAQDLAQKVSDALVDEGLNTGIGGHVLAGARFKLPIIPIAAYSNVKYYFGGNTADQFDNGVVFEVGGGFAF